MNQDKKSIIKMNQDKVPGVVVTIEISAQYHGFRAFLKDIFNERVPLPQSRMVLNQPGIVRKIAFNAEDDKKIFQIHLVKCDHTDHALEFLKTGATTHLNRKNAKYIYFKAEDDMVSKRDKFHSIKAERGLNRSRGSSDDISVSSSSSQVSSLSRVSTSMLKELRETKAKLAKKDMELMLAQKEKELAQKEKEMVMMLAQKDKELAQKDKELAQKEKEMVMMLAQKDKELAQKDKELMLAKEIYMKKETKSLKERVKQLQSNKL